MSKPPTVVLSPRTHVRLPDVEIEIPSPPLAPSKPSTSLWVQVVPVMLAALGMGAILIVGNLQTSGGTMLVLLFGSLLLVGGGAGVSIVLHRQQKAAYRRGTRERVERYERLLVATRDRLQQLLADQQSILLEKDPHPQDCVQLVVERASRLWERSPDDPDFMQLRVGLGRQPSSASVRAPAQPDPFDADPLIEAAQQLATWGGSVWGVPVFLPIVDGRSVGICGSREAVLETVRSLIVQLATHHAPDEVKLITLVPAAESSEWSWLRWLPHTWSDDRTERYVATTPGDASRLSKRLEELLARRTDMGSSFSFVEARRKVHLPLFVFLVADERLADAMPALARIDANPDNPPGAAGVFLATHRNVLPRSCRTILDLQDGLLTDPAGQQQSVLALDSMPVSGMRELAQALAPLRARRIASSATLPSSVSLLDLLEVESIEEVHALERWRGSTPNRSLSVPIGIRPGGETLRLDLHQRGDGPHGLIAGSTGSGKSALLQTLLLGLAATFHPQDVVMVLVDYKGGSTAGPLRDLPHLVGMITNLDGNLARRALVALQAEIERRQAMLSAAGCDDLDTYLTRRRSGLQLPPLPHLVLVVDEFAELKTERPDFIHQLVRTARVGRNVGLHLILGTQKPRPAVDEEIWANARFRICLRVEQPQDSQDVLKRPDAVNLAGHGQGYLQIGNDEVFTMFQGGWGGAPYRPDSLASDPHQIALVDLDGTRHRLNGTVDSDASDTPTQAEALGAYLRDVARSEDIARLPSIWLPPLQDRIVLQDIASDGAARWIEPTIGLVDDPAHRRQSALRIDLPRGGNVAIYGAPGTGKTTALLTLAVALATEHSPAEVHLYAIDMGGQNLGVLSGLPHCGGVVFGDEEEKLTRLLRHLVSELGRRKALFGASGVATLPAYRATSPTGLPAIAVVVDNLPALVQGYPDLEDHVVQIAQQGGTFGIHMAMTTPSPTLVRLRIANSFSQALTLRLADRADYGAVLSLPEGYEVPPQPGRGLIKGRPTLECQVALPARGATEAEQTATIRSLARDLDASWPGARPWRVTTLPEHLALCDLLQVESRQSGTVPVAPVGLAVDELDPFVVDLRDGPHFVITGPPRGGKSTLLRTWLQSLAFCMTPDRRRLYLANFDSSESATSDTSSEQWCEVRSNDDLVRVLDGLTGANDPEIVRVLAIDDFDGLLRACEAPTLMRLEAVVRSRRPGIFVLLAGTSSRLASAYDGVGQAVKEGQTGFLLGGSDYEDQQVLGLSISHSEASRGQSPGQGYFARRKHLTRVKIAEPVIDHC